MPCAANRLTLIMEPVPFASTMQNGSSVVDLKFAQCLPNNAANFRFGSLEFIYQADFAQRIELAGIQQAIVFLIQHIIRQARGEDAD